MMRVHSVEFEKDIDLNTLQKISNMALNDQLGRIYEWSYYDDRHRQRIDGVGVSTEADTYCRETLTGQIRRMIPSRSDHSKRKIVLVYVSGEARGISAKVLNKCFTDFAVEFLSHSGIPENIVRAGTSLHKSRLTVVFPITIGDKITDYTSASALILLLRVGASLVDKKKEKILPYSKLLHDLLASALTRRNTLWDRTSTIGTSTLLWYILHFFDLHNLRGQTSTSYNSVCNGPQSYYSGHYGTITHRLASLDDLTRIQLIQGFLGKKKTQFMRSFSISLMKAFEIMFSKLDGTLPEAKKVKKIKGASL